MNGENIWLSGIECCVYGKRGGATFNGFCKNSVLRYPSCKSEIHPTQKPVELFGELIAISSNEGDLVLDPFMGSATTAIACLKMRRHFIGFELDREFYEKAQERIRIEQSEPLLF